MITAEAVEGQGLLGRLVRFESRGPGDTDNALRRIARRTGVEYGALWSIRYRKPKRIYADVLAALKAAHAAEVQRQIRMLAHDAEITAAIAGPDHPAVLAAEAALRADQSADPVSPESVVGEAVVPDRVTPMALSDLPLWRSMTKE